MGNKIITISRSYGSGGRQVAKALAESLGIHYYDRELINMASLKHGVNVSLLKEADEKTINRFKHFTDSEIASPSSKSYLSQDNLFKMTRDVINEIADSGESAVILGRCAHHILKDRQNVVRVIIYADYDTMVKNAVYYDHISEDEAKKRIKQINKEREGYNKYFTGLNWFDMSQYDICLNTEKISIEECADVIREYIRITDRKEAE